MGKKVTSQASSLKISKTKIEKKQINSLIKVLRPKVYITDSSSFKKLVQELTGNGNSTTTNTPSPPPQSSPPPPPPPPISYVNEDYNRLEEVVVPESSSSELSVDSLAWQNQDNCFDEITALDNYLLSESTNLDGGEWSVYQDIESWLLDIEPFSSYSCSQVEQDVCIYDYELSGLL